MKRLRRRILITALLIITVFHPSCGTILTLCDADQEGSRHGLIYSGIRFDLRAAFDDNYMQHFPPGKLLYILDLPASLISDTVAFPVTAAIEYHRSRRTDERLYGTWKSDLEKSMEEFHRVYDPYKPSEEIVQKVASEYGKHSITFSKNNMLIEEQGERLIYIYQIVSVDTNHIVLR